MKLLIIVLLLISSLSHAENAKKIMEEVDKRDTGKTILALYEMTLINKNKRKTRELLWWRLNNVNEVYNLIKIKTPKVLKNTGLLIHSNKTKEDLTWLFLSKAAKKEPRKIASRSKDSRFLGSEFYYIDFEESGVEEFVHKYLKPMKKKKWSCHVIESIPKDKEHPYSKVISYVDKVTKVVIQADLYKDNEIEKIFSVIEMKKEDNIWTIKKSIMENQKTKKKTELVLRKIQYNKKMDKTNFSLERLTRDI